MTDTPQAAHRELSRALTLPGAAAISTGLAFAAVNFLGMAQLLGYISGPMSWELWRRAARSSSWSGPCFLSSTECARRLPASGCG